MNSKHLLISLILFGSVLSSCTTKEAQAESAPVVLEAVQVSGENGFKEYCAGMGYTADQRSDDACDNYVVCIYGQQKECEEADFQKGLCGQEESYCHQQGFQLEARGGKMTCSFADGSYCDEIDYFFGKCQPGQNFD